MSLPERPHDIVSLPYMPAEPGLMEWSIFALSVAALAAVVWWLRRPERVMREPRAVREQVLHAMNNLRTVLEDNPLRPTVIKQLLLEVSVLSRRAIHGIHMPDGDGTSRLEALTRSEISELLTQPLPEDTRRFLSVLLSLERYKYCPDDVLLADAQTLREQVQQLGEAATQYFSQTAAGGVRP
jgi:hypothetical protein